MNRSIPTKAPIGLTYERVRWLRERASELKKLSDEIFTEASLLESATSDRPLIGGREVSAVARKLLGEHGDMHYKALAAAIEEDTGMRIRGLDGPITLLANLQRDPSVEAVPPRRSGFYRLTPAAWDAS